MQANRKKVAATPVKVSYVENLDFRVDAEEEDDDHGYFATELSGCVNEAAEETG